MCWILERVRMWKVKQERKGNVITTTGENQEKTESLYTETLI